MLSQFFAPEFPEPMGVIYADDSRPTYNDMLHEQVEAAIAMQGDRDLQSFVTGSNTWTVE
jgi:2-oxoglutarate ferredoxin oxidoreductase subunit beta